MSRQGKAENAEFLYEKAMCSLEKQHLKITIIITIIINLSVVDETANIP